MSGGLLAAMAALGSATAANWLRGPTLLGRGGLLAEEVALAPVGGSVGMTRDPAAPTGMVHAR